MINQRISDYVRPRPKAISLYVKQYDGRCIETCRVKLQMSGDAYFIPAPFHKMNIHESFHISGELHWRLNNVKLPPLTGVLDMAMPTWLLVTSLRPSCACILCDNLRLSKAQIEWGLRVLLRVSPFEVDINSIDELAEMLKRNGRIRFLMIRDYKMLSLGEFLLKEQKKRIGYIRRLMEGTKFEKMIIPFEEALSLGNRWSTSSRR